jgi:hypothetical protein
MSHEISIGELDWQTGNQAPDTVARARMTVLPRPRKDNPLGPNGGEIAAAGVAMNCPTACGIGIAATNVHMFGVFGTPRPSRRVLVIFHFATDYSKTPFYGAGLTQPPHDIHV